jgi:hypothetical protein
MQECEDYIERIREGMHVLAERCGRRGVFRKYKNGAEN